MPKFSLKLAVVSVALIASILFLTSYYSTGYSFKFYRLDPQSRLVTVKAFKNHLRSSLNTHLLDQAKPSSFNNTQREELGRGTWRLLHLIANKYPVEPIEEDEDMFEIFILLLSKLYPCEECAGHFRQLLKDVEFDVNSRKDAVYTMCGLHNIVNKRLKKGLFDCSKAEEVWECGCNA